MRRNVMTPDRGFGSMIALWNVYDARGSRIGQAVTFRCTTPAMDKAPR
jgi:hypothetical protein